MPTPMQHAAWVVSKQACKRLNLNNLIRVYGSSLLCHETLLGNGGQASDDAKVCRRGSDLALRSTERCPRSSRLTLSNHGCSSLACRRLSAPLPYDGGPAPTSKPCDRRRSIVEWAGG